jgi:hypothetical protein
MSGLLGGKGSLYCHLQRAWDAAAGFNIREALEGLRA